MGTITLPNFRTTADVTMNTRLKDGGIYIDWAGLTDIRAWIYSDAQKAMAGRADVTIDQEDSTKAVIVYAGTKAQYPGINRLIIQARYNGSLKTYDRPVFNFVARTAEATGNVTIDDPETDVEIEVQDVSSSILDNIIAAALDASARANEAAEAAEHMVDIHEGPQGPVGETPDISIGTVTTVEPGTPAAATITGTPEAPILNLSIPKGQVGATPNITIGTVTTGQPGTPVVVTITGTAEAPVLNVQIPQGMQGNTGSSVEYPFELVNNTTTDDATKAATAAVAKGLKDDITKLEAETANVAKSSVTTEDSDLDVVDRSNNILVRFKGGHIETKNFDSRNVNVLSSVTGETSDLDVVDDNDNIILRLANGHIKTKYFDSSDIKSAYADFKNPLKTLPTDVTKPLHIGQVNVQRKVDALCDLPWTPIRPMPSTSIGFVSDGTEDSNVVSGRKYYTPNVEIVGIPYSSFGITGKSVGCDITIETFMTALKNPNSVLYNIDLRDVLSSPLVASYYGLNCSSFTNYVEGLYATCKGRNNRYGANRILRNPKNADALQIGDVIYLQQDTIDSGHAVIVYKIDKDADGFITQIHEAEEDGRKANKYSYTRQQFEDRFFKGGYGYTHGDIYRNVDLVDNLLYEDFDSDSYVYSDAVALNLGNNTNYNKEDNIPIEVTLFNGVTGFDLLLGGTIIGTYTLGDGSPGYGDTTIVTIDKSSLADGVYEIRPSSGLSQYFCLASPGVISVLKDSKGNISVSASGHSSNVSPYGVLLISSRPSETTRGLYLMDGEDNVVIPADWLDFINTTNDIAKLVVIFRNEYGNIYSDIENII